MCIRGGKLTTGVFRDTEAGRAAELVSSVTGQPDDTTFVAVFQPKTGTQSNDDVKRGMEEALAPIRGNEHVSKVITPDEAPSYLAPGMVNEGAKTHVAFITMHGPVADAIEEYPDIREQMVSPHVDISCTGYIPFTNDMNATLDRDLVRAELIALPLALLVLVLVFRTLVAATIPVGVGALAVLGGVGMVLALSHTTDVAMYTINVCSLIGLGVSIDYSLFMVSRYKEELEKGATKDDAIIKAVMTAGRTVAFSGLAVCVGLGGLFFFTGSYLFSMGVGGAIVVALAVLFALTALPALLSLLDKRLFAFQVRFRSRRQERRRGHFWAHIARGVMKRPLLVGIPTFLALVAMGLPFIHLELAAADVRVLNHSVEARRGYDILKKTLPDLARHRVLLAVEFPEGDPLTPERIDALYDLAKRAEAHPNVTSVQSLFSPEGMSKEQVRELILDPPLLGKSLVEQGKAATVGDRVVLLYALTDKTPDTEDARAIVRDLRKDRAVADGTLVIGGDIAHDVDATEYILSRTPHAIAFVVGATLILLFLLLRSVLLPIKAVLMNFLSMGGSFGVLVFIFQDGHFGVTEPRPLEPTLPVLLFCVLFGLSMDYEVLLLSRIREAYKRTKDNTESVAEGLQKTASLITSAAAIMVAVFCAFAFADVVMIQAVGVGMALAVALDATLVRSLLVPATMRLLGDLNWWAPSWSWKKKRGPGGPRSSSPSSMPHRPETASNPA